MWSKRPNCVVIQSWTKARTITSYEPVRFTMASYAPGQVRSEERTHPAIVRDLLLIPSNSKAEGSGYIIETNSRNSLYNFLQPDGGGPAGSGTRKTLASPARPLNRKPFSSACRRRKKLDLEKTNRPSGNIENNFHETENHFVGLIRCARCSP